MTSRIQSIEELIERSSLGTPEAKALRAQAPKEAVEAVLRRVDELDEQKRSALAGDVDQTSVMFDIKTKSGGIITGGATVDHREDDVTEVHLPPYFRDWAPAVGFDRLDVRFEGLLVGLAMAAFYQGAR